MNRYYRLSFLHASFLAIALLFIVFDSKGQMQPANNRISKMIYKSGSDTMCGGYLESLPLNYAANPTKKYPLLILCHGAGAIGNGSYAELAKVENEPLNIANRIKNNTFPSSFTVNGEQFSFIVISPQFNFNGGGYITVLDRLLDSCKALYRVDTNRIYITGLSMGGVYTNRYVTYSSSRADKFAATLFVCPSGVSPTQNSSMSTLATIIRGSNLPVWTIHNYWDALGGTNRTYQKLYIDTMNLYSPKLKPLAKVTIFDTAKVYGDAHASAWNVAYNPSNTWNGLNVFQWMLQYTSEKLVAKAGPDQTFVTIPSSITLDGSRSQARQGRISTYAWTKISGPSGDILTPDADGDTTIITGLASGTYSYKLTVTHTNASTKSDTILIVIPGSASNDPPTSVPGAGGSVLLPTSTDTLDGSASTAASGNTITTYLWTKKSSPTGGTISSSGSASTAVSGLVSGHYKYDLQVTDNQSRSNTATTFINVYPADLSPLSVPSATYQSVSVVLPTDSYSLDGSASSAAPGTTISSYLWTKYSGPAGGTITSPNSATTIITGLTKGLYVFKLKVTASNTKSATTELLVYVFGSDQGPLSIPGRFPGNVTLPTNTYTLDGSLSKAAPGKSISAYAWTKRAGTGPVGGGGVVTSPSSVSTTVTGLLEGSYTFDLMVTDGGGLWSKAGVQVVVHASATSTDPPTVVPGAAGTVILPTSTDTLDGSASTASAGNTIASYLWTKRSGPAAGTITNPNSATTTVTGLVTGLYNFDLTVTDNQGRSTTGTTYINVYPADLAPIAAPSNTYDTGFVVLPVTTYAVDGSSSSAAPGISISSYLWTKYSGPAGGTITSPSSAATTFTGLTKGLYVFKLKVTDSNTRTATTEILVYVFGSDQGPLSIPGRFPGNVTLPTNTYTLNGSLSSAAPNKLIVSYLWAKRAGTGPAGGTVTDPGSVSTTITGLLEGSYTYDLTVTDADGLWSKAGLQVVVHPDPSGRKRDAVTVTTIPVVPEETLLNAVLNSNPIHSELTVYIGGKAKGKTSITLLSLGGQRLSQQQFMKEANEKVNRTFNVARYAAGNYLLQINVGGKYKKTLQFVKL